MGLLDKLFKRNQKEKVEEEVKQEFEPLASVLKKEPSVMERYPNGLPLTVLELIDYSKFGAMLKQERILPPSYNRKPISLEIDMVNELPRVILAFKSETSDSVRYVSIYGYSVAYSTRINTPVTVLEVNYNLQEIWRNFAERVMWNWERGYRFSLIDWEAKERIGKHLIQDEMEHIKAVPEIVELDQKAEDIEKDL